MRSLYLKILQVFYQLAVVFRHRVGTYRIAISKDGLSLIMKYTAAHIRQRSLTSKIIKAST